MYLVGNDIVDLQHPDNQNKASNIRLLKKILTPLEILTVQQAANPNTMLWLLWSCKEAAYKVAIKMGIQPFNDATQISIDFNNTNNLLYCGTAVVKNIQCFTKTILSNNYAYSIASKQPCIFNKIQGTIINIKSCKNNTIKTQLLQHIAKIYNININNLSIQKNANTQIPFIQYKKQPLLQFDISFTHDGKWAAYIYYLH